MADDRKKHWHDEHRIPPTRAKQTARQPRPASPYAKPTAGKKTVEVTVKGATVTPRSTHTHATRSESVQPWPGGMANVEIDPIRQRRYLEPSGKVLLINPGEVPPAGSIPFPTYSPDIVKRFLHWLARESEAGGHDVTHDVTHGVTSAVHWLHKVTSELVEIAGGVPPKPEIDVPHLEYPFTGAGLEHFQ
jgi:hypothetical protein